MTTTIMFNDGPIITDLPYSYVMTNNCPVIDMNHSKEFLDLLKVAAYGGLFDVANIFTESLKNGDIAHYFDFFVEINKYLRRDTQKMMMWAFNLAYQTVYPEIISFLVNDTIDIDKTLIPFCHSICLPMNDQEIERAIKMVIRFDESHDLRSTILDHLTHFQIDFIL